MFRIFTTPSKTSEGQIADEGQEGNYKPLSDSTENSGLPREDKASKLRQENSKKTEEKESGSPIKQFGDSIKRGTQKIGNNFRTSIRRGKKKVKQKIPDDEEAVPQKERIRSIEGSLPAAASSPNLSRHSTLENLSTTDTRKEGSEEQKVLSSATLSKRTEVIRDMLEVVDSFSQSFKKNRGKEITAHTKFKRISIFPKSTQNPQEQPDSHGDSDSGVDLLGSKNSESPINTSVSSGSAEHVEEITGSFNRLIKECDSELSRLKKLQVEEDQECRIRRISFSSSAESLNSILSAEKETGAMQSDNEDELSEEESEIFQEEQEPQIQPEPQEPVSGNKETPTKKQSNNRNPNVTLALCYLAGCCFIAAAVFESVMLCLIGAVLLITAVVIEWQTPSRELTSISSNPHVCDKAVAKT